MKGEVGISRHEKERQQEKWPTPRQKVIHNPIPSFLFCSVANLLFVIHYRQRSILCKVLKRNKEVGMGL